MVHEDIKEVEHVTKHRRAKKHISANSWLIVIAIALVLGYVSGLYHFQIEAAIGPVFGYKSHPGNIDLSSLQETYNKLAANYDGELDIDKLIQGANSGLVDAVGDAYTVYMDPGEAKEYEKELSGNIGGGIGAEIGIRNDKVTIIRVLDNNPAKSAGLMGGDIILQVNDDSTDNWTVDEAVSNIRGEEGTTVKLKIQRGNTIKDFNITRAIINNPSVESSKVENIGIITISRFDDETGDLARSAAQNFKSQGVKGVILDLRGNGGGYIEAARDVAGIWLENKIVVIEKSGSMIVDTIKTGDNAILDKMPTVILVNGASASASEIVAGALQEYKKATVVGERTYGKGSVQQLIPLSTGAQLKVTTARWYTPNGINITQSGIKPNIDVEMTQKDFDSEKDPQLDKAKEVLSQ